MARRNSWGSLWATKTGLRQARLGVEALEDRTCPSAPQMFYSVAPLAGRMVSVTGQVLDERPEASSVSFGGVLNHSVVPGASGAFSFVAEASGAGWVTGSVLDDEGLTGVAPSFFLTGTPPAIQNLSISYGRPGTVILAGRVIDSAAAGLTVNFTGAATGSTTTDAQGWFSVTLTQAVPGEIEAKVFNAWGLGATGSVFSTNQPPVIATLDACRSTGNVWVFEGVVEDEEPEHCIVYFTGLPSLEGLTVPVDINGRYCLVVELAPGEEGTVLAIAYDSEGLASEVAEVLVDPT